MALYIMHALRLQVTEKQRECYFAFFFSLSMKPISVYTFHFWHGFLFIS
jgi:hypothetical protein